MTNEPSPKLDPKCYDDYKDICLLWSHLYGEVWEGKTARLPCVAHGHPSPQYYWFRDTGGQLTLVDTVRKYSVVDGTLVIHKVSVADSGKYICFANNSVGEDKVDRLLRIRVPLKVEVVTTKRVVRSGEEVSLNCSMSTAPKSVVWVKDQRRIVPDHRIRRISQTHLKILVFQREDSGIYQCYVYNDWESSQAHVQLDLKEYLLNIRNSLSFDEITLDTVFENGISKNEQ
ncbi:down syndrome cell adhesion molecule-like protein Dscam2 [Caerostris extrusa]|uniref:Down syndrome cell adhesion molecule-like protein Dscam2 n=1 Tax=Caerostris extrusa TaxID=172846 RepID=A0AAV4X5G5_CAEEX|nr:down syndrome cell adhesion molecule-like protein Dscam2 [Caerostris extrusa]